MKRLISLFILLIVFFLTYVPFVLAQSEVASGQSAASAVSNILQEKLNSPDSMRRKLWQTIFVIAFGYLLVFALIKFINRSVKDIKSRHVVRKNIVYIITFAVFLTVILIWIQNISYLTIFLGVAGAGLALALQEVIMSIAGWLLILIRRPYAVGDRIELNGIKGDIIDIRLFQTSLLEIGNWVDADQSTGRIVNIPNSFVFKAANYNYSRGFEFIWHEIPILVTFESDWRKARDVVLQSAKKHTEDLEERVGRKIDAMRNRYMIYYGKLTPIVYVNIKDSGVELTLRYLTEAKKRRFTQDQLCQSILEGFEKESTINFAYPTYRIIKE